MLSKISYENKNLEDDIIKEIYKNIDQKRSVIFNAGAGAGKTYALVQCLKYIINKYGRMLKEQNQKIVCITYTNVAADEIKRQVGNTTMIQISTIHERIWDFVGDYQEELVQVHRRNLEEQVKNLKNKVANESDFELYRLLSDESKLDFFNKMQNNKDIYYRNYGQRAEIFKNSINDIVEDYLPLLRSVSRFKKIVDTLFKIEAYESCIDNIDYHKDGYKNVRYNALYNSDQLHKMRISHDTLLEYGYAMISEYNLLKQIIIDKYPYIIIDEYQDTNELVVKIMDLLQKYSAEISHDVFIGYYGDSVQNIYDDGVGAHIMALHESLVVVDKIFNRRSAQEIINVANKIRNDGLEQRSIYEDCHGGMLEFYSGSEVDINRFIQNSSETWKIAADNPMHCFVLTNKSVAQYSGFDNLYTCLSRTGYYRRYFNQLNSEMLSNEVSKLGEVPVLLYRLVRFINLVKDPQTPINDIIPTAIYKDLDIVELKKLVAEISNIDGQSLLQCIEVMCRLYEESDNSRFRVLLNQLFDMNKVSLKIFFDYMLQKLYPEIQTDEEAQAASNGILDILNICMQEYKSWFEFIMRNTKGSVIYHTYHGTKGLEFDNVLIIMGNAFGRTRNYFDFFFKNYRNKDELTVEDLKKFEQIRNLLYVSVTRSVKRLRILYIDELAGFFDEVESIFGDIHMVADLFA